MRADARRNYDAVLAAARAEFAEHGVAAPLDDVARRAGVGNATLYRHFPTRHELIVAVYAEEVGRLCERGAESLTAEDPAEALFDWLRAFHAHVATKRDLALALAENEERGRLFDQWHASMHATAGALLERARRAGVVDAGLAEHDLLTLVNGLALAGADAGQARRLLDTVRRGTAPERAVSPGS